MRVSGLVGEEPYFHKDLATGEWSGFCVEMEKDLANELGAKLEIVESTWGNAILDVRSGKIDITFGVNPTPKRALVLDFSRPIFYNSFVIVTRKGFTADTWEKLNKPSVKIAVDLGSSHELIARHYCPKAHITAFKSRDEVIMAVQSARVDALVCTALLGLTAVKKNPALGGVTIPRPLLQVNVCAGLPLEDNKRFRDFVSTWAEYNRGLGNTRAWILKSLEENGIPASLVPPEFQF
jgi:polar amino acid transport system substrate-binding protein